MRAFVDPGVRPRTALDREEGFLLLEALVGLAIIGTVAIALLSATAQQVRSADKASVLLVASALAQDRAAALNLVDHETLASPPDSLLDGAFPPPFDEFRWLARVEPVDDEHDLFAVRIEVLGRGEAFVLETLVHRPAPVIGTTAGGGGGS